MQTHPKKEAERALFVAVPISTEVIESNPDCALSGAYENGVLVITIDSRGQKMCYISVSKNNITTKSNTTQQVESFMGKNITVQDKKKQVIDAIQPTDEHLTSRAGLTLFAQYLQNIRLMPIIERMFASMRKNKKGIAVSDKKQKH